MGPRPSSNGVPAPWVLPGLSGSSPVPELPWDEKSGFQLWTPQVGGAQQGDADAHTGPDPTPTSKEPLCSMWTGGRHREIFTPPGPEA